MADNYIIKIEPRDNGGRPALQSRPVGKPAPDGYVLVKAEEAQDYINTFVASRGFVNIEYADGYLTKMTTNQEALNAYLAENPDPDPVEEAYKAKTSELAKDCEAAINNGAEVTLSDGTVHHFSYTLADQANVAEMVNAVSLGASEYTYHADGQAEQVYGKEDIMAIYTTLANHKKQILTYHNLLKEYVGTLDNEAAIKSVKWGDTLPSSYQARYDELTQTASSQIALINKI